MNFINKLTERYDSYVQNIIQPQRQKYSVRDLGKNIRIINNIKVIRTEHTIKSENNNVLYSSLFESQESNRKQRPLVIYLHGSQGSRMESLSTLSYLIQNNFNLFCFDFSGQGISDGNIVTMGHREKDDVKNIILYCQQQLGYQNISLWGRSMGAVSAILAKCIYSHLPIQSMVIDSAFTKFSQTIEEFCQNQIKVPIGFQTILIQMFIGSINKKAEFDISEIDVQESLKRIQDIPICFVYMDDDKIIPNSHTKTLYETYNYQKQLLNFPGNHNQMRSSEYFQQILRFLIKHQHKAVIPLQQKTLNQQQLPKQDQYCNQIFKPKVKSYNEQNMMNLLNQIFKEPKFQNQFFLQQLVSQDNQKLNQKFFKKNLQMENQNLLQQNKSQNNKKDIKLCSNNKLQNEKQYFQLQNQSFNIPQFQNQQIKHSPSIPNSLVEYQNNFSNYYNQNQTFQYQKQQKQMLNNSVRSNTQNSRISTNSTNKIRLVSANLQRNSQQQQQYPQQLQQQQYYNSFPSSNSMLQQNLQLSKPIQQRTSLIPIHNNQKQLNRKEIQEQINKNINNFNMPLYQQQLLFQQQQQLNSYQLIQPQIASQNKRDNSLSSAQQLGLTDLNNLSMQQSIYQQQPLQQNIQNRGSSPSVPILSNNFLQMKSQNSLQRNQLTGSNKKTQQKNFNQNITRLSNNVVHQPIIQYNYINNNNNVVNNNNIFLNNNNTNPQINKNMQNQNIKKIQPGQLRAQKIEDIMKKYEK